MPVADVPEPAPTPKPTPEPQPKSFEELLSEKLSNAEVRNQIERVADSVKDLETIEQGKRSEYWGNFGLLDNGWYINTQWGFWNFSDGTNTIDASDLTAHYVSPDEDGNKLHLISIDASEQIKYLYAENVQKNEQGEVCFEAWHYNNTTKLNDKKAVVCY